MRRLSFGFAYRADNVADWVAYALMFIVPFLAGILAGPWAAAALPVAVLLALPAGAGSGEIPIWFVMMVIGLIAVPGIVVGCGARWFATWYARR